MTGWDRLAYEAVMAGFRQADRDASPMGGDWRSEEAFERRLAELLRRAGHRVERQVRCKMPGRASSKYDRARVDLYVWLHEGSDLRRAGVRSLFVECKLNGAQEVHACRQLQGYFQEAFAWSADGGVLLPRPDMGLLALPNGVGAFAGRHCWSFGCGFVEFDSTGIKARTPALLGNRQTFQLARWS